MKKKLLKLLKVFREVCYYLFFIALLTATATNFIGRLNGKRPEVFGHSALIVVSSSMEPTYRVKEFLIMKDVPFTDIKVGDIISFNLDVDGDGVDDLVTHRVIEVKEHYVVTKGDKESVYATEMVYEEMYEGKIIYNSYFIGVILHFLVEYNILLIIIALFFVYLIIKQTMKVVKIYKEEIKKEEKVKETK